MKRRSLGAAGVLLATAGAFLTAWLSIAPYPGRSADRGMLRLAWSGRPERLETCRRLTDEELEEVPAHMRQRIVCEGRTARYVLEVKVGQGIALYDTLAGGGARSDRPIHVLRDLPLPPGHHMIDLKVVRIDSAPPATGDTSLAEPSDTSGRAISRAREQRERDERSRARREALPPELRLRTGVTIGPAEVVLVTYDPEARGFLLLRRSGPQ